MCKIAAFCLILLLFGVTQVNLLNILKPLKHDSNQDIELQMHNQFRARHHAPPLKLSPWLSKGAQKWAEYLDKNKLFQHSAIIDGKRVGQNLYWKSVTPQPGQATKAWYNEVKYYQYGNGQSTFSKTGHFSQLVWKGSTQVGFGFSGGIVVANYFPPGNVLGQWQQNVQKP